MLANGPSLCDGGNVPSLGRSQGDKANEVIPSKSLRITWLSAVAAAVVAAAALFTDDFFDELLGDGAPGGARAAVFITVVVAWAAIAVADILARGYASAHPTPVAPVPAGLPKVTWTKGKDESGFSIAAVRMTAADNAEYLILKSGHEPRWVPGTELSFG